MEFSGPWEVVDGAPVSRQKQPASLKWKGKIEGEIALVLIAHPYSVIAEIHWDDTIHR